MNAKRLFSLLTVVCALPLLSCSGVKNHTTGGGNAQITVTLYDTPPIGVTLLSFTLPISSISLTPSTGSAVSLTPAVSTVEATRLQTDSALIVDAGSVPAGSYTSLKITFGTTSGVFINYSESAITYTLNGNSFTCANGAVCNLPAGASATVTVPLTLTLTTNQSQWIGLDLILANAIVTTGGIGVDFTQANVLTVTTTPRIGLPTGAADTIEDFVGTVTALSTSSITVQSGISGQKLTATLNSTTEYDSPLPTGTPYTGCSTSTPQTCLKTGSVVTMNANLSASGVLTATEVDVLDAKAVDEIEGVIYPTSNATTCPSGSCFGLILADKVSASGNSVLSASTTTYGTGIFLNVNTVNNFSTDSNTLTSNFSGAGPIGFASTADLLAGQQIRAHLSNMTSSGGLINATASNLLLRFSRLTGTPSNVGSTTFDFTPPAYITALVPQIPLPVAYTYATGTVYDGVTATGGISPSSPVSIRALFLNDNQPTFAVAKVRVP